MDTLLHMSTKETSNYDLIMTINIKHEEEVQRNANSPTKLKGDSPTRKKDVNVISTPTKFYIS